MISNDDICFYLLDPKTGVVIEDGHALEGRSVSGKVLIFPAGKGSSVVQADGLYQLPLQGHAPTAMIVEHPDTVLVASAIIIDIPIMKEMPAGFYQAAENVNKEMIFMENGAIVEKRPPKEVLYDGQCERTRQFCSKLGEL